jgi:hypothetical protein
MNACASLVAAVAALFSAGAAQAPEAPGASLLQDVARRQPYEARRFSSGHPDLHRNGDSKSIAPGETLVLGELAGPGAITHIWTTVGSYDPFHGRSLVLRIYWDGEDSPSVEAPLGDFFGVGHAAAADFTSLPVAVSSHGRARNCYWYMPFRESARVTVTNESEVYPTNSFYYYLDWRQYGQLPEDLMYFHAQYRQETPTQPGVYTILETEGRGHYVGTVHSAQNMELGWFGEGDDHFYIDGEDFPSIRGTGTEDYFGDAWGFRPLSTPFHGVSLWEGYFPGDRVTAYRWHLADPIPFETSLKVQIQTAGSVFTDAGEHLGQFIDRYDWVSSVAFWYQDEPVSRSGGLPPASERIAPYRVIPADQLEITASPQAALAVSPGEVRFTPGPDEAAVSLTFDIEEAGRYQITAFIQHGVMGGVYQPYLNGAALGEPLDLCMSGMDPLWVSLDLHDLEPGAHTLRFESRGRSPRMRAMAPPLHAFAMNYLILLRLEDMDGYHEALRRTLERQGR